MDYVFEVKNFRFGFGQCFVFIGHLFIKNCFLMSKCHFVIFQLLNKNVDEEADAIDVEDDVIEGIVGELDLAP